MVLYVVGLGLSSEKDITVRGLEAVKSCERVYLEAYTSILMVDTEKLSEFYGKEVVVADREMVESESDKILDGAQEKNVAFLVVGDPFGATTHTDLVIRARELSIKVEIIHNASIMNAIGACGLQLYNFGQTVSMVFFTPTWRPDSFYDRIKENRDIGLHTLVLLDIKVKEQSFENMARGRKVYEPPRYMTVAQCAEQMLEIEELRGESVYTPNTIAIGVSRIGSHDQRIVAGTLQELSEADLGPPLHSLVLLGSRVHELEVDYIREFALNRETFEHGVALEHNKKA
ncbi:diphthine synthase [Saitoella coloradoensis]